MSVGMMQWLFLIRFMFHNRTKLTVTDVCKWAPGSLLTFMQTYMIPTGVFVYACFLRYGGGAFFFYLCKLIIVFDVESIVCKLEKLLSTLQGIGALR